MIAHYVINFGRGISRNSNAIDRKRKEKKKEKKKGKEENLFPNLQEFRRKFGLRFELLKCPSPKDDITVYTNDLLLLHRRLDLIPSQLKFV